MRFSCLFAISVVLAAMFLASSAMAQYVPLYSPEEIAIDDSGNLYIVQGQGSIVDEGIYVYGADGRKIKSILAHQIGEYGDIAADGDGNVYVYNAADQRVVRLEENGSYSTVWREDLPNHSIACIGTGLDGNLYVSDFNYSNGVSDIRIMRLNINGTVLDVIKGTPSMPFVSPMRVSASANGTMYLAGGTRSLRVIYPDGGRNIIIHTTPDNDTFNMVADVVIGGDGYLYVGEQSNGRVEKLARDGTLVAQWYGCGPDRFTSAYSLAVDDAGRVYVSDRDNQRVVWFDSNKYQFDRYATKNIAGRGLLWDNVIVGDNYSTANQLMKLDAGIQSEMPGFTGLIACACVSLACLALYLRKAGGN
ncbi:MAG: NHL repeat-containing protein [Methanocella sp.]